MAEPVVVTGRDVAAEAFRRTFATAVAFGGALWAISRVTRLYGPVPGPRLREGEIRASASSARAESAYWAAEQAAAGGRCRQAGRAWRDAQDYRAQAEARAAAGDRTGRDLRKAVRKARKEIQLNCRRK